MKRVSSIFVSFVLFATLAVSAQDTKNRRVSDTILLSAVEQYEKQDYQSAWNTLKGAESVDPDNDAVQYYLGNILVMAGQSRDALRYYEKAYALDSANVWYAVRLGSLYNELRRPADALRLLEPVLPKKSNDPEVISSLMDSHVMMGNFKKADSLITRLELMSGESEYTRLSRLEILRQQGRFSEFFASLKSYFRESDLSGASKADITRKVMRSSDPRFNYVHLDDYVELADVMLEKHPADTAVTHFAVSILYSAEQKDRLMALCDRNQDDTYMIRVAIMLHSERGDYKAVVREADRMLTIPDLSEEDIVAAHVYKGDAYQFLGQKEKCIREYEQALKLSPDNAALLNNYAYFMACEGKNLTKCAKMSRRSIELGPDNATYLDTYAWILYKQKKYHMSQAYFKKAMLYGGKDSAAILEHYAELLDAMGDTTLAKGYREQAKLKKDAKKQ